jgi:hypothetical protein
MSKDRRNAFVAKVAIPNDVLASVDAAAADASQPRSHWILDAMQTRLTGDGATINRQHYPLAVQEVLKITSGKLTRLEAEHTVALVIRTLAQ